MSPPYHPDLFEHAPCGFLSFTDDGRVVVANATLLDLLGYEREELLGQHVETLMALPTRIFYQTHFFPLVKLHGRADEVHLSLRAKDGAEVTVFANAVRREEEGHPVNHCVLFPVRVRRQYEDELLKAKKEAEAALARNEALNHELSHALSDLRDAQAQLVQEEKLAGLGRMAAAVAHEVRNPLNFVINFAEMAEELLADLRAHFESGPDRWGADPRAEVVALLDDLTQNVERIAQHGHRVDAIVRGMMDYTPGGRRGRPRPVDVNRLVEEHVGNALERYQEGVPGGGAEVEQDYDPAAGEVEGEPADLGRVLDSLLRNAFEAVAVRARQPDGGGRADSFRPMISVRTRRTEAAVEIRVADNGSGVPEPLRGRVFEPFFTTKRSAGGYTGLGLSVAFEIVRAHGGAIEVGGEEGEGATFTVTLPSSGSKLSGGRTTE
jgi:PAS domain S-box-containing protein